MPSIYYNIVNIFILGTLKFPTRFLMDRIYISHISVQPVIFISTIIHTPLIFIVIQVCTQYRWFLNVNHICSNYGRTSCLDLIPNHFLLYSILCHPLKILQCTIVLIPLKYVLISLLLWLVYHYNITSIFISTYIIQHRIPSMVIQIFFKKLFRPIYDPGIISDINHIHIFIINQDI